MEKTYQPQSEVVDTPECRYSWRKTLLKHMKEELPPEAQAAVAEFVDLVIKVAGDEFVCQECRTKYRLSGTQGFII